MHGIQTIKAINSRNAEAERIMQAHGHAGFSLAVDQPAVEARFSKVDKVGHGSVQPWSAGNLFPGVIASFGDGTHQAHYRGVESGRLATYQQAANWIVSRKAEFSKGLAG